MLDFDEELLRAESPEDLKDMKLWMFREQVRIQAKEEELQELSRELQDLNGNWSVRELHWNCAKRT